MKVPSGTEGVSQRVRDFFGEVEAIPERDRAEQAKRAVEKSPAEGDSANRAADQGERNNRDAGDNPNAQDPGVADWITKWADEEQRDNEMTKRQPVRAIADEGVDSVGFF